MPEVKKEITGWRDEALSNRHRQWGYDCPACDIDFLMVEYNKARAVALVDYKNERAETLIGNWNDPKTWSHTNNAVIILANNSRIPFFITVYSDDFSCWTAIAANKFAYQSIKSNQKKFTELGWVRFLYYLRGISIPKEVEKELNSPCPN